LDLGEPRQPHLVDSTSCAPHVQAVDRGLTPNIAASIFATAQTDDYIYDSTMIAGRDEEMLREWDEYYARTVHSSGNGRMADIGYIYKHMAHICEDTFIQFVFVACTCYSSSQVLILRLVPAVQLLCQRLARIKRRLWFTRHIPDVGMCPCPQLNARWMHLPNPEYARGQCYALRPPYFYPNGTVDTSRGANQLFAGVFS